MSNIEFTPHDLAAATAIRALLAGDDLPAELPEIGDWANVVAELHQACTEGGVEQVVKTFEAVANQHPHLRQLVAQAPATDPTGNSTVTQSTCPALPLRARTRDDLAATASRWLDQYIDFSRKWSPRSYDDFHEACGLWLLSTIAARRVVAHLGGARYTNLSITLCARSSIWAKSTAAGIAAQFMREASLTHLLSPDDCTPAQFIRRLVARVTDDYDSLPAHKREALHRRLAFSAQQGWFYDEFGQKVSAMMREGGFMSDFRGILRRFDDCPETYSYESIGRGSDEAWYPYLALLASTTPADIRPFAGSGADLWQDGFWARLAFVTPPANAPRPRGRFPRGIREIPQALVQRLADWHRTLGIPRVTVEERTKEKDGITVGTGIYDVFVTKLPQHICNYGDDVYEAFYTYHDALVDIAASSSNTDLDGNYARFAEKALRIAMLLASLESDGTITLTHWHRGQQITERWRVGLHNLIDQVQRQTETTHQDDTDVLVDRMLGLVKRLGSPTANEISKYTRNMSADTITTMLETLADDGVLEPIRTRRTTRYRIPPGETDDTDLN